MNRRNRGRSADPAAGERGSVLVELTMVLPLLVSLVLGMMEMGMAWRDQQNITQASRQGARVASHLAQDTTADQQAVEAVLAVLDDQQRENINYIVVYEVTPSNVDGTLPAACKTGSSSSLNCNWYGPSSLVSGTFNGSAWPTTDRKITLTSVGNQTGPDRLGVFVSVHRPWFTGYFPGEGTDIGVSSVMQLEPDVS